MVKLKVGDPVKVNDPMLRKMAKITGLDPQDRGWVHEILDDGYIMVEFPIGDEDPDEHSQIAPYPAEDVHYDSMGMERK